MQQATAIAKEALGIAMKNRDIVTGNESMKIAQQALAVSSEFEFFFLVLLIINF